MKAEIISIADEILIGQIVNTNATFISKLLNDFGISCEYIHTIKDARSDIVCTISLALNRSDLVIVTGGLGPTNDDLTKLALCDYFNDSLIENKEVLFDIVSFFKSKGRGEISQLNKEQALVPSKAKIFRNSIGTAPGLYFNNHNHLIALPGVPYEMKYLLNNFLLSFKQEFKLPYILHKTVFVRNIPESQLANMLFDWEKNLDAKLKLAYLPKPGLVRLRLSCSGNDKDELNYLVSKELIKLKELVVFENEEVDLFKKIHDFFNNNNYSLSVAESCSGGAISSKITSFAGSSSYFKGAIIAYNNEIKESFLDINHKLIEELTSVSNEVAQKMSKNIAQKFNSDFSISTTGYAGPSGGDVKNPLGTVFISINTAENNIVSKYLFSGDRELIITQVRNKAFEMLYEEIKKHK